MERVRVTRDLAAPPERVRPLIEDREAFLRAAGFSDVAVDGDRIEITNNVGVLEIELVLTTVDREGAVLAYEQLDGVFEEMWTTYELEDHGGGTRVSATTEFELDVSVVGPIFDATVVKRQRRRELTNQFEYLASATA